jgi:hypothetical protein
MHYQSAAKFNHQRTGAVAILAAIMMVMLMGMVALAIDLGYIILTKTSMQAATDAACLSGGTELIEGMGINPIPAEFVSVSAATIAKQYAALHPNGDIDTSYIDPDRDVRFGYAVYQKSSGEWQRYWETQIPGVGGYNMIGVTLRRHISQSPNGDGPLPLIFAPVLGRFVSRLETTATAVIMPANGSRIGIGDDSTSDILPFVVRKTLWQKYRRAQSYYEVHGLPNDPLQIREIIDNDTNNYRDSDPTGEPLFGHWVQLNNREPIFKQDFADLWSCECQCDEKNSLTTFGPDGYLEIDIFPRDDYTSGNFGTVDIGAGSNSTDDIARQILHGVNEKDLSYLPNETLSLPVTLEGDTGVSAGIKDELASIYGQCRAMLLFSHLERPGNNAIFDVVDMAGIRVMHVEMTGALDFKHLAVQLCQSTLGNSTPDIENPVDRDTTVFTPLILID